MANTDPNHPWRKALAHERDHRTTRLDRATERRLEMRRQRLVTYAVTVESPALSMRKSITCLCCGKTSYNETDIRERFCGWCNVFHEDAL